MGGEERGGNNVRRYAQSLSPSGERVEEDDRYINGNLEQGV